MKSTVKDGSPHIISKRPPGGGAFPIVLWWDTANSQLIFQANDPTTAHQCITDFDVFDGEWHLIHCWRDGDEMRIYVDLDLKATLVEAIGDTDNTDDLYYGQRGDDAYWFDGLYALPCVYNVPLSLGEMEHNAYNPLSPIRSGLVLFHPMIEGVGTSLRDESGEGNVGTITGGVTWEELMKYELPCAIGL